MIRNEERLPDGTLIYAEAIDLDAGTITFESRGQEPVTRPLSLEERARFSPPPLDPIGVMATLNVVLGVWPLEDAANAIGRPPADLAAEAEAWGAAQALNPAE